MKDVFKIVGPPGTGKTTRLIKVVNDLIQSGVEPELICYIAFTKKAANEAKYRVADQLRIPIAEMPYFRTIHSLIYHQLNLKHSDVMSHQDYIQFGGIMGIFISYEGALDDGVYSGMCHGDNLIYAEQLVRATGRDPIDICQDMHLDPLELEQITTAIRQFKSSRGKLDFTDMLERFIETDAFPASEYLIVDEAQDLSALQWRVIEHLNAHHKKTWIAGDDDQAIFKWAGADVEYFINLPGEQEVLNQSYRVPIHIARLANSVISQVNHRIPKLWNPREGDTGEIEYITQLEGLDMSAGTWLLLARNRCFLDDYARACIAAGYMFTSSRDDQNKSAAWKAIQTWTALCNKQRVPVEEVRNLYDHMSKRERVKHGFKVMLERCDQLRLLDMLALKLEFGLVIDERYPWYVALDMMPNTLRLYYKEALSREPDIRINISTIHSAKGGEADNVVLSTDIAPRTFQGYQNDPEDEYRVWYTGITRAKRKLYVLQATTARFFEHL